MNTRGAEQVRDVIAAGCRTLASAGVCAPAREARRLLALAAGSSFVSASPDETVPPFVARRYRRLLEARARRVPLAFLEGYVGFLDFEVAVWPGVFIPRAETEELAERAIAALSSFSAPRILDLGTGTGVLALALARARPEAEVVAVDISPRALACARHNAQGLGLDGRIEFRRSDWYAAVPDRFHLIVANPPYVRRGVLPGLSPEIRDHEPRRALDGGPTGLSAIYTILAGAPDHLLPWGAVLLEIGEDQGDAVLRRAQEVGRFAAARVARDLSGKERFFLGLCG